MTMEILFLIQMIVTIIMGIYFFNALQGQKNNKMNIITGNKKEEKKLEELKKISLTIPLSEKSRPSKFEDIIGQEEGIKALKAALCGPNPQNVIIYGPPGVGKTAAARLVLNDAIKKSYSPFKKHSKFIELDATTIRFDERGIADPLIGSVHDPIYQGAGAFGNAGIPQPKMGAVTKAHGGILFIDEIGELHPVVMNKLLKVLEDRKVFLDSVYYNPDNENIPEYIKDIFENGFPADFRLIGATTKSPDEMIPALRSRCVEIFFRELLPEEIERIVINSIEKIGIKIEDDAVKLIGRYASNGREAVNLLQLAAGIAINDKREEIKEKDIQWIIENGQYTLRLQNTIFKKPQVGCVNGLAVYGSNMGTIMEIESSAIKCQNLKGKLKITGVVEEEEINFNNKKMKRKSTAMCSVENVITMLDKIFKLNCNSYKIHVNFPGGIPVDGPSAGISIATSVYSAIKNIPVNNKIAMTGEITLNGRVKAIGGVNAKIQGAKKAGANIVIIPEENWKECFIKDEEIKIIPVKNIKEVLKIALIKDEKDIKINKYVCNKKTVYSAKSYLK